MNSSVLSTKRFDVYASITQTIIAAIERGTGDFVMPWHRQSGAGGRPTNAATGQAYRGVNVVALWARAATAGYPSSQWATFRQWSSIGAQVRRGETGSVILFYKPLHPGEKRHEEDEPRRFVARASWVFNHMQVDGWEPEDETRTSAVSPIETADDLVRANRPEIRHGGDKAFYSLQLDQIHLPRPARFIGSPTRSPTEAYYATLLHELIHWTGAAHRLNRTFGTRLGDQAYAFEELVAELGAAFLCADVGLSTEPREDHAQYLASWLSVLSSDKRAIVTASRLAADAAALLAQGHE